MDYSDSCRKTTMINFFSDPEHSKFCFEIAIYIYFLMYHLLYFCDFASDCSMVPALCFRMNARMNLVKESKSKGRWMKQKLHFN